MEAFIALKEYALNHKDLTDKLNELESRYNKQFKDVYEALNYLLQKDKQETAQQREDGSDLKEVRNSAPLSFWSYSNRKTV